jgi:hypothetical protein
MQRTASSSIVKHRLPAKAKLVQVPATGDRSFFHLGLQLRQAITPAGMWAAARSLLAGIDKVFNNNWQFTGRAVRSPLSFTLLQPEDVIEPPATPD